MLPQANSDQRINLCVLLCEPDGVLAPDDGRHIVAPLPFDAPVANAIAPIVLCAEQSRVFGPHACCSSPRQCVGHNSPAMLRSAHASGRRTGRALALRETFCLANPNLPDCPLTHVSDGFIDLT
eukprot:SAG11_NODE_10624_length_816_cov_1.207810_1_plen_123_part_10